MMPAFSSLGSIDPREPSGIAATDQPRGSAARPDYRRPPTPDMLSFRNACRKVGVESVIFILRGTWRRTKTEKSPRVPLEPLVLAPGNIRRAARTMLAGNPMNSASRGIESASRGSDITRATDWIDRLVDVHPGALGAWSRLSRGRGGRSSCASGSRSDRAIGCDGPYRRAVGGATPGYRRSIGETPPAPASRPKMCGGRTVMRQVGDTLVWLG